MFRLPKPFSAIGIVALFFSWNASITLAADALDLSALPRVAGGTEVYSKPEMVIYTAPGSVEAVAKAAAALLEAQGWRPFVAPNSSSSSTSQMQVQQLKNGPHVVSLFTTVAPALANATSVQVTPIPVEVDLPFPGKASQIAYEPRSGILKCTVQDDIGPTLAEFRDRLMASGWQISSHPDAPPQIPIADPSNPTRQSARLYFVQTGKEPLRLVLSQVDLGKTVVDLKKVREAEMQTEFKARQMANRPQSAEPAPKATAQKQRPTEADDEFNALTKGILGEVRKATEQALKGGNPELRLPGVAGGRANSKAQVEAPVQSIHPLADNKLPIPLPADAASVDFDGADGQLKFDSAADPGSLAAFYRAQMKPAGWSEIKTPINQPNMKVLEFKKKGKSVTLTIMASAAATSVTANGSALETEVEKQASADNTTATATGGATAPVEPLTVDDFRRAAGPEALYAEGQHPLAVQARGECIGRCPRGNRRRLLSGRAQPDRLVRDGKRDGCDQQCAIELQQPGWPGAARYPSRAGRDRDHLAGAQERSRKSIRPDAEGGSGQAAVRQHAGRRDDRHHRRQEDQDQPQCRHQESRRALVGACTGELQDRRCDKGQAAAIRASEIRRQRDLGHPDRPRRSVGPADVLKRIRAIGCTGARRAATSPKVLPIEV